jgi:hypothetical protein
VIATRHTIRFNHASDASETASETREFALLINAQTKIKQPHSEFDLVALQNCHGTETVSQQQHQSPRPKTTTTISNKQQATSNKSTTKNPHPITSMNNTNSVDTPARRVNMDDIEESWSPADER